MPSSVAVMISDEVASASGLFSSTGKLAMRLNTGAAAAANAVGDEEAGRERGQKTVDAHDIPEDRYVWNSSG